MKKEQSRG